MPMITKIERTLGLILVLGMGVAVLSILAAAGSRSARQGDVAESSTPDRHWEEQVVAQSIVLVDSKGRTRMQLGTVGDDRAEIAVYSRTGVPHLMISSTLDGLTIDVFDGVGSQRVIYRSDLGDAELQTIDLPMRLRNRP